MEGLDILGSRFTLIIYTNLKCHLHTLKVVLGILHILRQRTWEEENIWTAIGTLEKSKSLRSVEFPYSANYATRACSIAWRWRRR
jgi:hypothetical protein